MDAEERPSKIRKLTPSSQLQDETSSFFGSFDFNGHDISNDSQNNDTRQAIEKDDSIIPGEHEETLPAEPPKASEAIDKDDLAVPGEHGESLPIEPSAASQAIDKDESTIPREHEETLPAEPSIASEAIDKDESITLGDHSQDLNEATRLSKNQRKKLMKQKKWEDERELRKVRRKEKNRNKKQNRRNDVALAIAVAEAESTAASKDANALEKPQKSLQTTSKSRSTKLPITFIFDCSFDDLMLSKERLSLCSQLTRCYSDNQKAKYRAQLAVSSFSGHLKERFNNVLMGHYKSWKAFKFLDEDFVQVAEKARDWMTGSNVLCGMFAKSLDSLDTPMADDPDISMADGLDISMADDPVTSTVDEPNASTVDELDTPKGDSSGPSLGDVSDVPMVGRSTTSAEKDKIQKKLKELKESGEVIYLTSDSPNTLTELKPYSTYIIGGLVDKNRHKGICYQRAMDREIKTARLPIGDYMDMTSRFVLTTNHVSEIMLKWLELGDWGEAFLKVIPKRKGGSLKETRLCTTHHDGDSRCCYTKAGGVENEVGDVESQGISIDET